MNHLVTTTLLAATMGVLLSGDVHALFLQTPEEQSDGRVRVNWIGDDGDSYTLQRKLAAQPFSAFATVDDLGDDRPALVPDKRPVEYVEASPLPAAAYNYRVTARRNGSTLVSNTVEINLDFDGDGVRNLADNCALPNAAQTDSDGDGIGDPCEGPDTYDDFVAVIDGADLKARIEFAPTQGADVLLYLPHGDYMVDNPITIDRTGRLVIQGETVLLTKIGRSNCDQPLFVIEAAGYVNFANVNLLGGEQTPCDHATNHDSLNGRNILAQNTTPIHLEIQESWVTNGMVEMRGAGTFRTQNVFFNSYASYYNNGEYLGVVTYVDHQIVIDHPGADFFGYGGGIGGGGKGIPILDPGGFSAVQQKKGRVRTFMFQTSGFGASQYEFQSPSTLGAHEVAAGRNEQGDYYGYEADAETGSCDTDFVENTVLVSVPSSQDRVDVMVKGHVTALERMRELCGFAMRLVDYSAAGRLWLLANVDVRTFDHLATGNAPKALVLAAGNHTYGDDILQIAAESVAVSGNLFNNLAYNDVGGVPNPKLVDAAAIFENCTAPSCAIAPIPGSSIPKPLDRPRMNAKLPGMIDVTEYGAQPQPDGDDTLALQTAFDAAAIGGSALSGKPIYFPSGTYRISEPLYYVHGAAPNHPVYPNYPPNHPEFPGQPDRRAGWAMGGWIAGAGSGSTFIVQSEDESVFATEGARFMTFQGISFNAFAYTPGGVLPPNVSLDNDTEVGGPTNSLFFYDTHFNGGDSAVGIVPVLNHRTMGSEIVIVNSKFSNARTGVFIPDTGNNAIMNGGYNVEFENLEESAIDTGDGSFYLTHASISGIGDVVIDNAGGGHPHHYLYGVTMDTPSFMDFQSVLEVGFVESSTFTSTAPVVDMFKLAGGGITFLNSDFAHFDASVGGDTLAVGSVKRAGYGLNLNSDFTGWDVNGNSLWTIDKLCDPDSDGDCLLDDADNCLLANNKSQYDSDGDGFGNMCDADYDQNGVTDMGDFLFFRGCFLQPAPYGSDCDVADQDGDGEVGAPEFLRFRKLLGLPPGPSVVSCADPHASDVCPVGQIP